MVADQVTVRLVGQLAVAGDGSELPVTAGGSRQARAVLALLAVHRDRTLSAGAIAEVLWPATPPRRPVDGVATLVSRLRAQLGPGIVTGGRDGYRLGGPPGVEVDLDRAAGLVATARGWLADAPALSGAATADALHLLGGGEVLVDHPDAGWAEPARAQATALLRAARHIAAEAAIATGEVAGAVQHARSAVRADPYDEPAVRLLMSAHQVAGEPAYSLAAFDDLRRVLADDLGTDPDPATAAAHERVLRGQPAGAPIPPARAAPVTPPVGRARELARLHELWTAAAAGAPGIALVHGEAGIGKTTLVDALARAADAGGATVLASRCYAAESSLFLQPLVDALGPAVARSPAALLRGWLGGRAAALADLIPAAAPQLGGDPQTDGGAFQPPHPDPDVARRRVFEAVTAVVRGMAGVRPVLLVLDDLHTAGLSTVELLHHLVRHVGDARLLVVATVRTEEGSAVIDVLDLAVRVELGPLRPAAVAELAALAGHSELAELITRRTRGHPLFVAETLRALTAGEVGVPETLQVAVLARVRRAGAGIEEFLRAAAVLGATVDAATTARMLAVPVPIAVQRCEQALAARLVVVAGRDFEFANDLVREVLYETTPAPVRLAHHRMAADLLTDRPEAVATHAEAAGDGRRAARAWLLAGEQALRRFAASDAVMLLSRALARTAPDPETAARAHLARGRAHEALGGYPAALADLESGVTLARAAGDRRIELRGLFALGGDVPIAVGRPVADCTADLRAGLRIAESLGDRAAQAEALGRLAILSGNRLRFVEALEFGRRAADTGRAARDDRALAAGLDGLKSAVAYLGEIDQLDAVIHALQPLAGTAGYLWPQWTVFESAFPAIAAADWDAAMARIDAALALNAQRGYPAFSGWWIAHQSWVQRLRGRIDDAIVLGRRAVGLSRSVPHRWAGVVADSALATALLQRGDRDAAAALLSGTRAVAERGGAEGYLLRCLAPLAEATGSPDVLAEADALLAGVSAPAGSAWMLGADAYLSVARAWLAVGDPQRARLRLEPLLVAARRVPWQPVLAESLLVDGRATEALGRADAGTILAEAAELADRFGMAGVTRALTL